MTKKKNLSETNIISLLIENSYLFQGLNQEELTSFLPPESLIKEKLFSNRPVFTAFLPDDSLDSLYVILEGGPVVTFSNPLDRIISITYRSGCFGMRSLPFSYGLASKSFPSLVEAYKTTYVTKIPLHALQLIHDHFEIVRLRYAKLFELREKFTYHLLNCSSYPPQAVSSLLRGLIYQERELQSQPNDKGIYIFDLSVEVIAKACQLNQRTVEQVLKGMQKEGLINLDKDNDTSDDIIHILKPEELKEVYSSTRDKVSWWPLK
ncbi:MAG: Crp/Fnr family transcriptional regulator [Cyanobacteria bacterium]|nr:Crp/Fnr family transcriptional regulator [Cyanobacteria bacterium CG_2015-16_32_12]NCO79434.1 Crp/Fnr family transcriptional regulator [Cyanobacteria bacterium CG_2015-22_32_23]NCQ05742.1 Crp/Fnr family transcriptional regulator [Cyanobacteria bacterium CG_2015-09_32_10]NCQ42328.1 Crp/Fnr family transcriptional regulator [Cyanobacteria bacterium CG_2015-04_32_10]NCS85084.1 Crp/Fnr family transcriptional regulator [Cyanobacteria bacterium CG_2015-02_32_10]